MSTKENDLTVYYDQSCVICRTEIDALELEAKGCELRDCSIEGFTDPEASAEGITQDEMMDAIHVRDAKGEWSKGIDAFVLIYTAAGRHKIAKWLAKPALRPMWDRLYRVIVRNRHVMSRLKLHKPMAWLMRPRHQ